MQKPISGMSLLACASDETIERLANTAPQTSELNTVRRITDFMSHSIYGWRPIRSQHAREMERRQDVLVRRESWFASSLLKAVVASSVACS